MFQASLLQETRTACHCLWFSVLAVAVVVPESRVARYVHCAEDVEVVKQHPLHSAHISLPESPGPQQLQPGQKTLGSEMQFCSPDDGSKDARNMLRSNWLLINHYLLYLVGLAFICLYKMHGESNIIFRGLLSAKEIVFSQVLACAIRGRSAQLFVRLWQIQILPTAHTLCLQ
jgi:hypothetical protein